MNLAMGQGVKVAGEHAPTKSRAEAFALLAEIGHTPMWIKVDGTGTKGFVFFRPLKDFEAFCERAGIVLREAKYSMWSSDGVRWHAMDRPGRAYIVVNR